MTHEAKHAPRRLVTCPGPRIQSGAGSRAGMPAAALIGALALAGCSSGNIGESWQCPLAKGGSCDSVAAADPAVSDAAAARATVLGEPLWQVRGERSGATLGGRNAVCTGGLRRRDSIFFGWLARLFGDAGSRIDVRDRSSAGAGGDGDDERSRRRHGRQPPGNGVEKTETLSGGPEPGGRDDGGLFGLSPDVTGTVRYRRNRQPPPFRPNPDRVCGQAEPAAAEDGPVKPDDLQDGRGGGADLDRALRRCRTASTARRAWIRDGAGAGRLEAEVISRLLELFEGPEAPGPWAPPMMPAALHALLPWRAWDESSETYVNAGSAGFVIELPPFAGHRRRDPGRAGGHARRRRARALHHPGDPLGEPALRRGEPGLGRAAQRGRRGARPDGRGPPRPARDPGGWRRLYGGGPPFTLSDYRVFVTACLAAGPGPATETALGAFRRALEGTLASAGAQTRRLEPDALLSLAAELTNPDIGGERDGGTERPPRRWAPRDPLHEQCIAPGRAVSVHPTGLTFHHPDGGRDGDTGDIAVRVLSGHRLPRGLAGLARQRADRRLPPRLPATGLPGADLPHRRDRRRSRRREGVPEEPPARPSRPAPALPSISPACPRRRATGRR